MSTKHVTPNFITDIIEQDLADVRYAAVVTRFPPEPNGYAHLGHAVASYLNWGIAQDYQGQFRLRLDDTNPEAEKAEFAQAIIRDMQWLGYQWGETSYASNYFAELHAMAVKLIERDLAYVDSVNAEEMATLRGTPDQAGTASPYRNRSVAENLELFADMKAGKYANGQHVLRAKIGLGSSNMKMRDPVIYRIVHAEHYRTGNTWCIYPSYDFAQATTDALDGVTHSLCSLEFIDNRAVYDWLMDHLWQGPRPHQYEFGRRSLEYTVVSKRKLKKLVEGGYVEGWDDPRMPTISGLRKRGVRPQAVRDFASKVGITRTNRTVDISTLEGAIRDDLNTISPRVMGVVRPLAMEVKGLEPVLLTLPYYPEDVVAETGGKVTLPNGDLTEAQYAIRQVSASSKLYIEKEDFEIEAPAGFKRLSLGSTVRLRGLGVVRCDSFDVADDGSVSKVYCSYLGHDAKAKGVIHWVDQATAIKATFKLYDRLFLSASPEAKDDEEATGDFLDMINPDSLEVCQGYIEASVVNNPANTRYQLERLGYFWQGETANQVFTRIITLKDSWHKDIHIGRPRKQQDEIAGGGLEDVASFSNVERNNFDKLTQQGVSPAEALVIIKQPALESCLTLASKTGVVSVLASWIVNELGNAIRSGKNKITPSALAEFSHLLHGGQINSSTAKEVLLEASTTGEPPASIVARKGLQQISDVGELEGLIAAVVAANPDKVAAYKAGKTGLIGFFVGQVMRQSGGKANPQTLQELMAKALEA